MRLRQSKRLSAGVDRLSTLLDELVIQIVSCLPTKDAVATSALSWRWRRVYTWMTNLEFDATPIYVVPVNPELIPCFTNFVQNVLQTRQKTNLSRFCIKVDNASLKAKWHYYRDLDVFHDVKSTIIGTWISYSLAQGVRELDLCACISNRWARMPPDLFSSGTLEVLKLHMNICPEYPQLCHLPNLKVCHFKSMYLPEGGFITSLLSGCPSLEDLAFEDCSCPDDNLIIKKPSLMRLVIDIHTLRRHIVDNKLRMTQGYLRQGTFVLDTPNLHYFKFSCFAQHYSVEPMDSLYEATIDVESYANIGTFRGLLEQMANVRILYLHGTHSYRDGYGVVKDTLPNYQNLHTLQLDLNNNKFESWRILLLEMLRCAPCLEMLTLDWVNLGYDDQYLKRNNVSLGTTSERSPSCLRSHLKRIVIRKKWHFDVKLELAEYFLKNASVLEKLKVVISKPEKRRVFKGALKKLRRASANCSIKITRSGRSC